MTGFVLQGHILIVVKVLVIILFIFVIISFVIIIVIKCLYIYFYLNLNFSLVHQVKLHEMLLRKLVDIKIIFKNYIIIFTFYSS